MKSPLCLQPYTSELRKRTVVKALIRAAGQEDSPHPVITFAQVICYPSTVNAMMDLRRATV